MTDLLVWSSEALPVRSRSKQLRDAREEDKSYDWIAKRILSEHRKYADTMEDPEAWARIAAAKIKNSL